MNFDKRAPKHSGNPEKVFERCKNLETHLFNCKWETIPNEDLIRMLGSCIMGPPINEIVSFRLTRLAFKKCETWVFSQEKYQEGRKQEYLCQETGKRWRSHEISYWQDEVIRTSICSGQDEPGRIEEWNAHGTVYCRVEGNMPVFYDKEPQH